MKVTAHNTLLLLASLITLLLIIALLWAVDKGLDVSDEGFALLAFQNPDQLVETTSFYPVLFEKLFGWFMEPTIINLRVLRLIFTLVGSTFLGWSICRWLIRFQPQVLSSNTARGLIILIAVIGGLLSYSWLPQTPSYNNFTLFALQLILGVLLLQNTFSVRSFKYLGCLAVSGIFTASLILIKFPSFFLVLPLVALSTVFNQLQQSGKLQLKFILRDFLVFALGIAVFSALYFGSTEQFLLWKEGFLKGISAGGTTHSLGEILGIYVYDLTRTINDSVVSHLWVILPVGIALPFSRKIKNEKLKVLILVVCFVLVALVPLLEEYYLGGSIHKYDLLCYYVFLVAIAITAQISNVLITKKKFWPLKFDWKKIYFVFLLIFAPVAGIFGTNTSPSAQILIYMSFVLPLIWLLIEKLKLLVPASRFFFLATTLIIAASQVVTGVICFPYRQTTPLTQANASLEDITSNQVMVGSEFAQTMKEVKQILDSETNYRSGDLLFAFSHEVGLVYLLDGEIPVFSWYESDYPLSVCNTLQRADSNNLDETIFLIRKSVELKPVFHECLQEIGINFPDGYEIKGEVDYSYEGKNDVLQIYAPKSS